MVLLCLIRPVDATRSENGKFRDSGNGITPQCLILVTMYPDPLLKGGSYSRCVNMTVSDCNNPTEVPRIAPRVVQYS
jgi:hypothetical protein